MTTSERFVAHYNSVRYYKNMEKQKRAYLYAIAAVLFWSTIASAFKKSLPYYSDVLNLSILHLLFYSSLVARIDYRSFYLLIIFEKVKLTQSLL